MVAIDGPVSEEVGQTIPVNTAHAVSVVLPTWAANVGYEEGEDWVVKSMRGGYPRFFIGLNIQRLAVKCVEAFGVLGKQAAMLFPSRLCAKRCRDFLLAKAGATEVVEIVDVHEVLVPGGRDLDAALSVVLYDAQHASTAKQYWQHTGEGISSRFADYFLEQFAARAARRQSKDAVAQTNGTNGHASPTLPEISDDDGKDKVDVTFTKPHQNNRYYSRRTMSVDKPAQVHNDSAKTGDAETLNRDQLVYLEERYGRCLSLDSAKLAKRAVRRRIAGSLTAAMDDDDSVRSSDAAIEAAATATKTGHERVHEDDVYLYSCGMAAIFNAHRIAMTTLPNGSKRKSVCFGFPYTDTLKILEKWGPGAHFYGRGDDADLSSLTQLLESGENILAVFCECPSNPLLRTPPLAALRALADKHGFLIVVDETIGNFINVDVSPYADVVVSSLTKIFSGDSNVMGGSLVLNAAQPFYSSLKRAMAAGSLGYEDTVWCEDAVTLERNSRDFVRRIRRVDANAEFLADLLVQNPWVDALHYPKFGDTRKDYDLIRRPLAPASPTAATASAANGVDDLADSLGSLSSPGADGESSTSVSGGFGGLFSVVFASIGHARCFFDALQVNKGPSLGTNFTLASPYTLLAHYTELDWAASCGVPTALVRVSVGLESRARLREIFDDAVGALEAEFGTPDNLGSE